MIKHSVLTLILAFATLGLATAQRGAEVEEVSTLPPAESDFTIYYKGNNIGSYSIKRDNQGNKTIYNARSEASVRIFGTITVSYDLKSVFQGDQLVESSVVSYKNGKVTADAKTRWNGSHYEIVVDGDKQTIDRPIKSTSALLYFGPPEANQQVYSEKEGVYKVATKKEGNAFLVADPGESKGSLFHYNAGKINQVNIAFVLGEFTIKR